MLLAFPVCADDIGGGKFRYLITGRYTGGEVPEGMTVYELCGNANVEWYDCMNGEKTDKDYHSAIWIPVKRK